MPGPVESEWIFASGSLIWRPGFAYVERRAAVLPGYVRRFWQASHDHRGTPERPGRVVTLVADPAGSCHGILHRVEPGLRDATLAALDVREQDGYERVAVHVRIDPGELVRAVTWIARPGNPSWVGKVPEAELAVLIATRAGPSGTNADYLFELAAALRELGVEDGHVHGLETRVRRVLAPDAQGSARPPRPPRPGRRTTGRR